MNYHSETTQKARSIANRISIQILGAVLIIDKITCFFPVYSLSMCFCYIANISLTIYFKSINSDHESFLSSLECLLRCYIFTQRSYFWHSKNCFSSCWQEEFTHYLPMREKYLLCLRKGKKEPLSNDTGKEKKKMLNFKKDKMIPPLWIFSRTTHCCLSIVTEANSHINASLTASIS